MYIYTHIYTYIHIYQYLYHCRPYISICTSVFVLLYYIEEYEDTCSEEHEDTFRCLGIEVAVGPFLLRICCVP